MSTSHVVVLQKAKAGPAPVQTAMPMAVATPNLARPTRDLLVHEALHVDDLTPVEPYDRGLGRGAAQGEGVRTDPPRALLVGEERVVALSHRAHGEYVCLDVLEEERGRLA